MPEKDAGDTFCWQSEMIHWKMLKTLHETFWRLGLMELIQSQHFLKRAAGDDAVGQNDLGGPGIVVLWTIEPFFLS